MYETCQVWQTQNYKKKGACPLLQLYISTLFLWLLIVQWGRTSVKICCCSVTQSCLSLCKLMDCSTPGFPVLHCLLEFVQTHIHWVDDAIQPSQPLSPASPAPNLSSIRAFSNESVICIRWPKYWSFSISPSNEYSGLISFMMDWFDLCYPRTLERLLQHQSSKVSILQHSAFFNGPTLTSIHD